MNGRYGKKTESKRVKRKPTSYSELENITYKKFNYNTEIFGEINYDPIFGWIDAPYMGKDATGTFSNKYPMNKKRSDGLPGSSF